MLKFVRNSVHMPKLTVLYFVHIVHKFFVRHFYRAIFCLLFLQFTAANTYVVCTFVLFKDLLCVLSGTDKLMINIGS